LTTNVGIEEEERGKGALMAGGLAIKLNEFCVAISGRIQVQEVGNCSYGSCRL
jgi:hypothetical protein